MKVSSLSLSYYQTQQYFKHIPFMKKDIYCTVIPINKVSVKSLSDFFYMCNTKKNHKIHWIKQEQNKSLRLKQRTKNKPIKVATGLEPRLS